MVLHNEVRRPKEHQWQATPCTRSFRAEEASKPLGAGFTEQAHARHAGPVRLAGPRQSTMTSQLRASQQTWVRAGAQARMHLAAWQKTLVTVTEVAKKARRAARKGLPLPPGAAAAPGSTAEPPSPAGGKAAGVAGGPGLADGEGGVGGGVGSALQAELDEAMERVQKWQDDVVRLRKCVRCAARPAGKSHARARLQIRCAIQPLKLSASTYHCSGKC